MTVTSADFRFLTQFGLPRLVHAHRHCALRRSGGGRLYVSAYPGLPMTYGFKSAYSMP